MDISCEAGSSAKLINFETKIRPDWEVLIIIAVGAIVLTNHPITRLTTSPRNSNVVSNTVAALRLLARNQVTARSMLGGFGKAN